MLIRVALLTFAACLWAGCSSPGDRATDSVSGDTVTAPCAVFSEEVAQTLGNGPYQAGEPSVTGSVSLCARAGDVSAPIYGATARFEKMTKAQFLAQSCQPPLHPETKAPLYEVDTLTGLHEAACRIKLSGGKHVGLHVLTGSGWAIMVGSAPEEKCLAAIEAMIPKLPK